MEKKTYSFSEIIFGLRDEYIKNYKLLNELKKYIHVDGVNSDQLLLSTDTSLKGLNVIRLDVLRKQSKLLKFIEYIAFEYLNTINYNNEEYILKRENDEYAFGLDDYKDIKAEKKHNIEITDSKLAYELIECILNSDLMKLKEFSIDLNPFQSIYVEPSEVTMYTNFSSINSRKVSCLHYNPSTDTIYAYPNQRNGKNLVIDMLDTEIPTDFIPSEYREIIDRNLKKYKGIGFLTNLYIDGDVGRRSELGFEINSNEIMLYKKRKLKIYE